MGLEWDVSFVKFAKNNARFFHINVVVLPSRNSHQKSCFQAKGMNIVVSEDYLYDIGIICLGIYIKS